MTMDATFTALIAFTIFFIVMAFLGVPGMLLRALDARRETIAKELHDARRMREEAEKLLAEYEAKRGAAEAEAQAIIATAREQAEAVAEETRAQMTAAMARRERQAEDRIAQAGAKAADEVRAAAAEAAIAAAEKLIRERLTEAGQSALVNEAIAELRRNFAA